MTQQPRAARIRLAGPDKRLRWMLVVIMMALTLFMGRALQLQALDSRSYAAKAAAQMTETLTLQPQRGTITDRFGTVLAASVPAVQIIADPLAISRNGVAPKAPMSEAQSRIGAAAPQAIANILARHLGGRAADYLPRLTARDRSGALVQYQVVVKQIDASVWNDIAREMRTRTKLPDGTTVPYWFGLVKKDNPRRIYPAGSVGGNVVGLARTVEDSRGNLVTTAETGIEKSLDDRLRGTPGKETYESSAYGRIPLGTDVLVPAVDGDNVALTLDATLQQAAEASLAKGVVGSASSSGTAIVMNVKTGEVLADASVPNYDPNKISTVAAQNAMLNRSVESQYEPGSVQKVLTMAALTDKGLITPESRVVVPSRLASGDGFITDSFDHGTLSLYARGVVALSSNVGTSLLARQMDKATFINYLASFGLGQRTGIQLPGEVKGSLPSATMPDYTRDQISFGQGLAVTAIQEASAVAGIINDGIYNPPTLLKQVTSSDKVPVNLPAAAPRRIISRDASVKVRDMMEAVIQLSPQQREIPGYRTIGKSGTAERIGSDGRYSGYTSSFALAAPAENPQILVYVVMDQPVGGQHAGSQIALPVAQEVMKLALPRYGVLPGTTPPLREPIYFKKP